MYQIELICVTGQHGRTVVLLNAFTLYRYIWKKNVDAQQKSQKQMKMLRNFIH